MATDTATTGKYTHGMSVYIDHPRCTGTIYTFDRMLKTNARVTDPNGRGVNVHPLLLRPADGTTPPPTSRPYRRVEDRAPGQIVTLQGKPGYYVVLKANPRGYSVAKVGGAAGGSWWNAPDSCITNVSVDDFVAAMATATR